nr:SWIM zinc finger family protein [Lysobacter enzymogenes]
MESALTAEQALALAPDGASAKAATGLASDRHWVSLGGDAEALWGECKGSGAKPYQAQVDLGALVTRCSCPSRKFPCKHALALLLMHARGGIAADARPAWVEEWLNSRRDRAEKKEQAAAKAVAAQAADRSRRRRGRERRPRAGSASTRAPPNCSAGSAISCAAGWLRSARSNAPSGRRWRRAWSTRRRRRCRRSCWPRPTPWPPASPARRPVVERFGLIWLLREAVVRRATLSPQRLADVRAALGWVYDKDDLSTLGESVSDRWIVQGQRIDERDDRLFERRVWLRGQASGRDALLHDYAYGGRGWEQQWLDGRAVEATLRFFPGSAPLRRWRWSRGAAQYAALVAAGRRRHRSRLARVRREPVAAMVAAGAGRCDTAV